MADGAEDGEHVEPQGGEQGNAGINGEEKLPAESVHQEAGGDAQQEKPDEAGYRNEAHHGVTHAQVVLDIIGRNTHEVHEAHDEKAEHHRQDGGEQLIILSHID